MVASADPATGPPRLLTAADGQVFSRKDYYLFGAEIEDPSEMLLDDFESGDTLAGGNASRTTPPTLTIHAG